MKKVLALLLMAPILLGLTVVFTNSAVVTWDESPGFVDGTPFGAGDVIGYEVVVAQDKEAPESLGMVEHPPFTVTLPAEGEWLVGVRTVRTVGAVKYFSEWLWSDQTSDPFVLRFYRPLAAPADLRVQ